MTDTNTAQMVADLQATDSAVRGKGWVASGLGVPGAPLSLLGGGGNPLSGLAAAGLGWFMPLVSFLGDGLTQLQGGNAASVTSGSQDFGGAGQDIGGVADTYRESTTAQTTGWTGQAADEYRAAGEQHADGVAGLGEASTTTASAIIGAGQVVAQAIAEVTELIAEAVAQIVPIMTQAIARAGETFGQSVVEAIPPCVGIAVEYALRIVAKLAALVASGDNLMKLVQGGMAVVDLINQALSSISQQSVQADGAAQASAAVGPQGANGSANAAGSFTAGDTTAAGSAGVSGSASPSGSGGGGFSAGGQVSSSPTPSTYSSSAIPPAHDAAPNVPRSTGGSVGGGGAVTGAALPLGAAAHGASSSSRTGSRVGRGATAGPQESTEQSARTSGNGGRGLGGVPMGAMGGLRPAGEGDKEYQRKYRLVEQQHDEVFALEQTLPAEVEDQLPDGVPVIENRDDEYFTNPPEIMR